MNTTPEPAIDGLFIAPDSNDWPCIWHEPTPGHERPELVMGKPYGTRHPLRRLWDLLTAILPERDGGTS